MSLRPHLCIHFILGQAVPVQVVLFLVLKVSWRLGEIFIQPFARESVQDFLYFIVTLWIAVLGKLLKIWFVRHRKV